MSSITPEPIAKITQDIPGELTYWKKIPGAKLPDKIWEKVSEEEFDKMIEKRDETN
ncbi:hypothetical protein LCGC14_2087880 [marine sediment metagenome]|uniref:Uncharacterized protein n=1 Tax=marine sediment metagenome TaxID=412755 RepID=A0A0F9EDV2_9ZZZZ